METDFPNIRHLRAFQEVAVTNGISKAAANVHLSQPAVTQAVRKFEDSLDIKIFERRKNGLFLNDAGKIIFARVIRMFDHLKIGASLLNKSSAGDKATGQTDLSNLVTAAHLKALIAVSQTKNFTIAARSVGLSQPTIHRAARDLEKLADVEFFILTKQGVMLTPAATRFVRQVKLAQAEIRQGIEEIESFKGRDSSKIFIGAMPLARTSILPNAMHQMLSTKKNIQIVSVDAPYAELLNRLRHAELDVLIGALRNPAPTDDVIQEKLFEDDLSVIVNASHPLTLISDVTLDQTLEFPWIAPPKNTPAGTYLYEILQIAERDKTPVRTVSSSLILIRGLLAQGDYVTVMSKHQIRDEINQGLVVPLKISLPKSNRMIGLTYRKDWQATKTQHLFLDLLREQGKLLG